MFQRLLVLLGGRKDGKAAAAALIIVVGRQANLFVHVPLTVTLFVLIVAARHRVALFLTSAFGATVRGHSSLSPHRMGDEDPIAGNDGPRGLMTAWSGIQRLGRIIRRIVTTIAAHRSAIALVVALVLPLGWVAYDVWLGEHGIHAPGPVTTVHQRFDCKDCHIRPWQPLGGLVAGDQNRAHLVMDRACVGCHQGLGPHGGEIPRDAPTCVSCHHEHRGVDSLTLVLDGSCTTCHADLHTDAGPSTRYARSVTSLGSHPEFAPLQPGRPDRATIRFNHARHLPPTGLPGLDGKPVMLECTACHRPTPDRRYMEPIAFQAHCAGCHANALAHDVSRFRKPGLPHGVQPELLRGLLRERYTQFIRQNPGDLKRDDAHVRRPIPGRSSRRAEADAESEWVDRQVGNADRILFRSSSGCRYCHTIEGSQEAWQIAPTNIAERWFGHSRFSHFSHRLSPKPSGGRERLPSGENCTECHEFARRSTRTEDVLMPSIGKCRECHDPKVNPKERARFDCVSCHRYHNEPGGPRPIDRSDLGSINFGVVGPKRRVSLGSDSLATTLIVRELKAPAGRAGNMPGPGPVLPGPVADALIARPGPELIRDGPSGSGRCHWHPGRRSRPAHRHRHRRWRAY